MTVDQQTAATDGAEPSAPRRRSRRDEILQIAVGLFAARGYHGVSMDDIGAAAGVTGPALYHHFAGKEAMLAAALIPVSEELLEGGRVRVAARPGDATAALAALIEFHVEFALANPAVIALHLHELDRLPEEPRRRIRRLQRLYVEEWVAVLTALRHDLDAAEARVLAHAAFGLMNSTPFLGGEVDRERRATLLRAATLAALHG
ncbi:MULTISPECIES: TetR/AcrR family transcriptional regulator [unclassified Solwaraspora]|uniref:TetR/AcrR family transcriptional regulator n=1 Tax=unclassified Solwaraspora TaxID=2627926 RepID=UPI00248C436E|nr:MULTISPECIES: TetR/AcrR family transcriptional regulator [unclassified Solwaraspora]WBB96892.1 TetR/AcrR family transcriptional regulator [Solwaraspora sp. WMMA2059]WBC19203.1 TetR/AcrR family transcriptional regulator [Solwaraspora sp. WMMA2080]WJK33382.1 TetR/AcrR family transcriptional regulator [Solwaraspora sp. WMMA2065]